jgi:GNAT superfamily N-acetyltransferase
MTCIERNFATRKAALSRASLLSTFAGRRCVSTYDSGQAAFWPDDSVVIAKIEFRHRRFGHGTELLEKLVGMSERFGFRSIGIEQTGSDDSIQNFVRKFGFENHRDKRNWLVSVEALKARLAALPRPGVCRSLRRKMGASNC